MATPYHENLPTNGVESGIPLALMTGFFPITRSISQGVSWKDSSGGLIFSSVLHTGAAGLAINYFTNYPLYNPTSYIMVLTAESSIGAVVGSTIKTNSSDEPITKKSSKPNTRTDKVIFASLQNYKNVADKINTESPLAQSKDPSETVSPSLVKLTPIKPTSFVSLLPRPANTVIKKKSSGTSTVHAPNNLIQKRVNKYVEDPEAFLRRKYGYVGV